MKTLKALRGVGVAAVTAIGLLLVTEGGASAATLKVCVPEREGGSIVTPTKGACKAGSTLTELGGETKAMKPATIAGLSAEEEKKLVEILPFVKLVKAGVGKKPTLQVSGANVQIVRGAGDEKALNGAGNLIVGYDESPGTQTGSNNLVVGNEQTYTGFGGINGGIENTTSGGGGVAFGSNNKASETQDSVTGGQRNSARGNRSSVTGGFFNGAFAATARSPAEPRTSAKARLPQSAAAGRTRQAGKRRPSAAATETRPRADPPRSAAATTEPPKAGPRRSPAGR